MNPSKDLVAASAVSIVLSILLKGDSYGYEILKTVEELSGGRWLWSDGMLYPILHRLEKNNWIRSYWSQGAGSRRRKYYHLEPDGLDALREQKEQWMVVHRMLEQIWPEGGEHDPA